MGSVTNRTNFTSRGFLGFVSWYVEAQKYALGMLMIGSNPISKLEIVSFTNLLNLPHEMMNYYSPHRTSKYNPKVYLGTIQSVSLYWNQDWQTGQNNGLENQDGSPQKSGSLYIYMIILN